MSVQILLMQRYLTNNFSQSESFQPLERMHFNNLIQPLDFSNHSAWQILFQLLEIPTIEIGENTSLSVFNAQKYISKIEQA